MFADWLGCRCRVCPLGRRCASRCHGFSARGKHGFLTQKSTLCTAEAPWGPTGMEPPEHPHGDAGPRGARPLAPTFVPLCTEPAGDTTARAKPAHWHTLQHTAVISKDVETPENTTPKHLQQAAGLPSAHGQECQTVSGETPLGAELHQGTRVPSS